MAAVRAVGYIAILGRSCTGRMNIGTRFPLSRERNTNNGRRTAETCVLRRSGRGGPGPDRVCDLPQRHRSRRSRPQQGAAAEAEEESPHPKAARRTATGSSRPPSRPIPPRPTTVKEYKFKPAEKLPPVKGTAAYKPLQEQHRPVRAQRLGRLGADRPGQQRFQGRQGMEDGRRQAVQGRSRPDRQPGPDARRLRRWRGPYRLGDARHGAAVPRELRRCPGQPAGQPDHAPDLPAGRFLQRRRRRRRPREHQDRGRPPGQEAGPGPELAVALLRPQHAGLRRRAAVRGRR